MKRAIVAAIGLAVLAGCSSSGNGAAGSTSAAHTLSSAKPCSEVFRDGAPADAKTQDATCSLNGSIQIMAVAQYACKDGTKLEWNDLAWWTLPGTIHTITDGSRTAPDYAKTACLPPS